MNFKNAIRMTVLALALTLVAGAWASGSGTTTVRFTEAVNIAGQELPAGEYKVKWVSNGETAQLSFKQGKREVTLTAALAEGNADNRNTRYRLEKNGGSARKLAEIQIAREKKAFVVAEGTVAQAAGQ